MGTAPSAKSIVIIPCTALDIVYHPVTGDIFVAGEIYGTCSKGVLEIFAVGSPRRWTRWLAPVVSYLAPLVLTCKLRKIWYSVSLVKAMRLFSLPAADSEYFSLQLENMEQLYDKPTRDTKLPKS